MTLIADAQPADWPAIIAAVFAGISGLATLAFGLYTKARQTATELELATIKARAEAAAGHAANASQHAMRAERSVQQSREERTVQIDEVRADVGSLRTEVREGINASNNYNGKIDASTSATQAIAEEMRQMRQDSQPISPPAK